MKKIDIHAHVAPLGKEDGKALSAESLVKKYDEMGIEKGVLLPLLSVSNPPGDKTAEAARKVAEAYPDRFFWFTTLDLKTTDAADFFDLLSNEKEKGARGVGEITSKLLMTDEKIDALFEACGKLSLPITFHIAADLNENYGVADQMGLTGLDEVLGRHPNTRFLGHAVPFWSEISTVTEETRRKRGKTPVTEGTLPKLLRKHQNLLCDLSAGSGAYAMMRDEAYAARFLTEFQDRVFYGCDILSGNEPFLTPFSDFLENLVLKELITKEVYEKVTRTNALLLLCEK